MKRNKYPKDLHYNIHSLLSQAEHDAIDRELHALTRRESWAKRRELALNITDEEPNLSREALRSPPRPIINSNKTKSPRKVTISQNLELPAYPSSETSSPSDSDCNTTRIRTFIP